MEYHQLNPYDVPGFNRATGTDDLTPHREYRDEPPLRFGEYVTEWLKYVEDVPKDTNSAASVKPSGTWNER